MANYSATFARVAGGGFTLVGDVSHYDTHDRSTAAEELSRQGAGGFVESIFLAVLTTVEMFSYSHFVDGKLVRGLTYAGDYGWMRVEGLPEEWEEPLLFSAAELDRRLAELDDIIPDPGARLAKEVELRQLWQARRLGQGRWVPAVSAEAAARAVARHHQLPEV